MTTSLLKGLSEIMEIRNFGANYGILLSLQIWATTVDDAKAETNETKFPCNCRNG